MKLHSLSVLLDSHTEKSGRALHAKNEQKASFAAEIRKNRTMYR